MKKVNYCALIALGVMSQLACADETSFTLYGVLDASIGHEKHSLGGDGEFPATVVPWSGGGVKRTAVPNSVTGIFNGSVSDSRIGLKGVEDLGSGMKAFFTLESGFNLPTGAINNAAGASAANGKTPTTANANSSLNGQFFNRQAFVGLSDGALGSIALGRNYAPIFDIAAVYDPVQNAQLFSPLGFSGTVGGGGGVSEDTRVDNSLKYSNKIGAFNFGALFKTGEITSKTSAGGGYALNGGYDANGFGVQVAYQVFKDAVKGVASTTTADAVAATVYDTQALFIATKYKVADTVTLKAGFEHYKLMAPTDSISVSNYYGQTVSSVTNFAGASQPFNVFFFGGDMDVTSNLNLAAGIYSYRQKATSALNGVAGISSGHIDSYSFLADYRFTKRTDVYAGLMYSQYKGDAFIPTTYWSNNYVIATGMRVKF